MDFLELTVENSIALLTISNEKSLNALNSRLISELNALISDLSFRNDVKVIIITGKGKAFVVGADIKEMANMTHDQAREYGLAGETLFEKIERLNKVVIAAINGYALGGGCELAMACDIRIANTYAKFGQPEVHLGIIPGFSGCYRLPRIVGQGKAKELIFSGKTIDSAEASKIGLVDDVVEADQLMSYCMSLANTIAKNSQYAILHAKRRIEASLSDILSQSMETEANVFASCFDEGEQKEGMKAFLEKRNPCFK